MKNSKILLSQKSSNDSSRSISREELTPAILTRRKQIIRLYLTAILLLSMMFTVYIWQSTKMVEIKLRINRVEKDISNIENGNADLKAEISKLQSLSRIEQVAKNELGMVVPKKLCYITMPEMKY